MKGACAPNCSILTCRLTALRCVPPRPGTRRGYWSYVRARHPNGMIAACAICRICCAATLHRRLDGSHWRAFVKPAKRLSPGDLLRFGSEGNICFLGQLDATVEAKGEGGEVTLAFAFHGPVLDQATDERGAMPLPPYIASRRHSDAEDRAAYQSLFANVVV